MRKMVVFSLLILAFCVQSLLVGDTPKRVKRAKPPTFDANEGSDIFFADVFTEALRGTRSFAKPGRVPNLDGSKPDVPPDEPGPEDLYAWSAIISAASIESEIKRIKLNVDKDVTTPTKFASSGYKRTRKHFSMLAMLFAIAGEYDKDVRWKKDSPELRDAFAHAAGGSKVGSQQAYKQAKGMKQDLQDVVGGGSFTAAKKSERKVEDWSKVVDRAPLMQRIDISKEQTIGPYTGSESEFKGHKDELMHEANLVAAVAEVLMQESMEDGDEEEYAIHAKSMKKAALDIIQAAQMDNYDMARKAAGQIGQACSNCHADWK